MGNPAPRSCKSNGHRDSQVGVHRPYANPCSWTTLLSPITCERQAPSRPPQKIKLTKTLWLLKMMQQLQLFLLLFLLLHCPEIQGPFRYFVIRESTEWLPSMVLVKRCSTLGYPSVNLIQGTACRQLKILVCLALQGASGTHTCASCIWT